MNTSNVSVTFCGVTFPNPFVLPSGIITEIPEHTRAIEAGAGGVTLKSLTKERREGNPLPRVWKYDHGMINSVGLRNSGIEKGTEEVRRFLSQHSSVPVIVSIFSTKIKEFVEVAEKIAALHPPLIELNLSCPNTEDELGRPLGMEEGAAGQIVKAIKKVTGNIPVLAKLSPNVTNIAEIARVCEQAGADGIVAINTVGPGMIIDVKRRKPVLGGKRGGVSGPGIHPVAIRCIYEIYEAVRIPILGMGGVTTVTDVVETMMAGASLVGVGTATYFKGMALYKTLTQELQEYMQKEHIDNLASLVGVAHEQSGTILPAKT